ncbi:hypothetical protein JZ751_012565 [Albula glossodonta]|uniref:Uncharacterized protein n=1 Tax=Albula glossodonta TaxID=121402 RepID=A0A8T2NUQ9_9TELE|nr:hypothetical protein JZ751_012565 [Albula glossodonta]
MQNPRLTTMLIQPLPPEAGGRFEKPEAQQQLVSWLDVTCGTGGRSGSDDSTEGQSIPADLSSSVRVRCLRRPQI